MGVDTKRAPPLPAPTETETTTPTELTTDVSKPGDEKSSFSIPDDGTPVTIRTRGHKANKSQTSLLIEYFEGSKSAAPGAASGAERKPSVRVRLTPSRKGKGDHIQLTETKGSRKASLTRRIPLDQDLTSREIDLAEGTDASSMTSYASQTEESNVSRNPIDIEIDRGHRRHRPKSPLVPSNASFQPVNPSEISAIPDNSFLDGSGGATELNRASSPSRGEILATAAGAGALAGLAMDRIDNGKTRSGTRERVKISDKSREKTDKKRRTKSRTSSVTEQNIDDGRSPRRRSSRGHQESAVSGADSSVLSSGVSHTNRSVDTQSMRSGASRSSINNPKLLETVEDAIRRLILPELSALKREQSKRETRRSSLTSTGTSVSREDVTPDRRRSSGQRSDVTRESKHKSRRNREARHDYEDSSPLSMSRESLREDYEDYQDDPVTPKRSGDLLKAAAAGAALSKGMSLADDRAQSEDRKTRERRRRRTDSSRSRSLGRERYADEYGDDYSAPPPPMPLMSDINPSEMTRTSILSAETDRPHSASEEMGNAAARELGSDLSATTSLQQALGTGHANVSHGDLTALPRGNKEEFVEYEADEYGRKVPIGRRDDPADEDPHDYPEDGEFVERSFEDEYYSVQDVPPPLKYVPYQAGARGLSPIPSVSGYTEGGSEAQQRRDSRSIHSASDIYPSPEKSLERAAYGGSAHSLDSIPSNMRSREFDHRSVDDRSVRSAADNRDTMYTEDSEVGPTAAGQAVRGIGANPNIVHPPSGVESAVASLVEGSMVDQSVLTSGSGHEYAGARESTLSNDQSQSSRGVSPEKQLQGHPRELLEERHATPSARSQDQSQGYSEYELDEYGRKVQQQQGGRYRQSPTASEAEAAITAGAVGAAAAALKRIQERRQPHVEDYTEEGGKFVPAGIKRDKSFKERTLDVGGPRSTPAHSIDRFSYDGPTVGASAIPDMDHPMLDPAYVEKGIGPGSTTTHDPHEDEEDPVNSGRGTPTQRSFDHYTQGTPNKASSGSSRGFGLAEAAVMGAGVGMASAQHSREPSHDHDYWHRTSHDGKRDTLVTNPYEDASPIVNPELNDNLLNRGLPESYGAPYHAGSPGFGKQYDEGYMSQANRTPDIAPKGKAVLPLAAGLMDDEDPFVSKGNARQLSGMSQGMASPFYDASTGTGIDRIENKDIVALMQHRSARDTEIVALLMNAALEMRNSFREMKDLIQDTGDDVVFAGVENTEKIQKYLNAPRPYPGAASRSIQSASQPATIDDAAAKKKNLWKRALAGLSAKGTNDLSRIEDMLNQLLGEVDVLKTQTANPGSISIQGQSFENLQPEGQYEQDRGYEPEGVSTASHGSQSGHLSISQPEGRASILANERKFSGHRISTVEEHADEYDDYDHPSPTQERTDANLLSAAHTGVASRGGSVPPDSPARASLSQQQTQSADNTPRTERGKKHKSNSSSGWIPKISRWSETTASSVGRAIRGGGNSKKEPKYEEDQGPSRSGSSLASYEHGYEHDPYTDKLHTGFSDPNLAQAPGSSGQPPVTTAPEDPKYKAHRNSLNLQHPQPRTGQTEHFRALEYSAQEYDQPETPRSADWGGSATSLHRLPHNSNNNSNRYSNASSAAPREGEYYPSSDGGQSAPPRPPKEPISNSSYQSPRSNRVSRLQKESPLQNQIYEPGYGQTSAPGSPNSGSPRFENRNLSGALGVPARRPSGPRAMTPKSPEEEAAREERRRKRGT